MRYFVVNQTFDAVLRSFTNISLGKLEVTCGEVQLSASLRIRCSLGSALYSLVSVVVHMGSTASSGHYYAWAKHTIDGTATWWEYNDAVRKQTFHEEMAARERGSGSENISLLLREGGGEHS